MLGERTDSSASASAAGTRSWREAVAGSAEEDVGAAHPGREADHRDLGAGRRARRPRAPEECPARLERDDDRERREDGRQVRDDAFGVRAQPSRSTRGTRARAGTRSRDAGFRPRTPRPGRATGRPAGGASGRARDGRARRPGPSVQRSRSRVRPPRPRRTPTSARGTLSTCRHPRSTPTHSAASATITSTTNVSVSVEPSANVSASAPNTTTSDHASVAETLRTPSARASSQPGARTTAVANASLRYRKIMVSA